jgi:RecB family exonuclease
MYKNCPHNWYLQYVKKHKRFDNSINLTFGTSLHEALQEYLTVMYTVSGKAADSMELFDFFKQRMVENYKEAKEQNGGHFTTQEEFGEFIEDGLQILDYIKKKRSQFFSLKNEELIGVEIPITEPVVEEIPNVLMIGSIDLIMRSKTTGKYKVLDIKTSTSGWKDKDKKDQTKLNQLLFYKHFYSKKLGVDPEMIDVEFFIVRRKVYEDADFPIKRVQHVIPAQGKIKMKQAVEDLRAFVKEAFTPDGKHIDKAYPKNTNGCKYCPFKDDKTLCDKKNI